MWKNILNKNDSFYDSKIGLVLQAVITKFLLNPYYRLFFRMEVRGRENFPKNKRAIIASNHSSHHDPPLLAAATGLYIAYMAKKELFDVPVLSQLIAALGAFPVNRQKLEIKTIKTAKRIISSKKWNLGIFPQGTRIMDGTIGDIKPGFSHLAKVTRSTVIPVYIDLKRGKFPFYGKIVVNIDKPLPETNNPEEILENWKERISKLAGIDYVKQEIQSNNV